MSAIKLLPKHIDATRLLVKGFPPDFLKSEIQQFLRLFGANEVTVRGRNSAYATFDVDTIAKDALKFLHQYPLNDNLLSVEYARMTSGQLPPDTTSEHDTNNRLYETTVENNRLPAFVQRLTATNDHLNFTQPPPPHLKYVYPKQNRDILDSICIALESSTKFYTQVLHLMNRMNMEPPFVPGTKSLSYPTTYVSCATQTDDSTVIIEPATFVPVPTDLASDESELESTDETSGKLTMMVVRKRKRSDPVRPLDSKRMRSIIASAAAKPQPKTTDHDRMHRLNVGDAFEKERRSDRSGNIKIVAPISLDQTNHEQLPVLEMKSSDPSTAEMRAVSPVDLSRNQIPINQLATHPLFQNYDAGKPSNKLYIKNLAKTVDESDLRQIYQRYSDPEKEYIDIRLMQSGRMKGQAFVTFKNPYLDDTQYAVVKQALHETNGYILKDKVMVVTFGKM